MKLVTNKVPVILNGMHPALKDNGTPDWSKVVMLESGTVLKVMAVSFNMVFLDNSKYSLSVDINVFKEFFTEHEVEV